MAFPSARPLTRAVMALSLASSLASVPPVYSQSPTTSSDHAHQGSSAIELLRLPTDRPLNTAFLIIDGVYNTELVAPFDVFEHTVHHTTPSPGMNVFTVSPDGRPITSAEGLQIVPSYGFANAPAIDILVVPSAENSRDSDLENRQLVKWVEETGQQARFVVSLCWGAFLLAEAQLLDDRSCTTFPSDYETFAKKFPDLDLKVNVSFVHDGKVLTSQGGVRSYDVAMYLVDLLYGEEVAHGIGAGLLIPWPSNTSTQPAFMSDPAFRRVPSAE